MAEQDFYGNANTTGAGETSSPMFFGSDPAVGAGSSSAAAPAAAAPDTSAMLNRAVDEASYNPAIRSQVGAMFGTPEGRDQIQQIASTVKAKQDQSQQQPFGGLSDGQDAFYGGNSAVGFNGPAAGAAPKNPSDMSHDELMAAHPELFKGRPVVEGENESKWTGLARSLAMGAAEYGRPGLGGELLTNYLNRKQSQINARNSFDANVDYRARDQMNQERAATDTHNLSEVQQQNLRGNNPLEMRKAEFLNNLASEAGNLKDNPAALQNLRQQYIRRAALSGGSMAKVSLNDIDDIIKNPIRVGAPQYKIEKGPEGMPLSMRDPAGYAMTPDQIQKDPQAKALWDSEMNGYSTARKDKRDDATFTATQAADRQGKTVGAAITAAATQEERKKLDTGRAQAAKHLADLREVQNQNELVQQLAKSKSPTDQTSLAFKALGLDLPDGVHRINEAELNAIRQQGGLGDKAYRAILNWKDGEQFAPEILKDIGKTAQRIADSKEKTANDSLEDTYHTYGYRDDRANERGRLDGPIRVGMQVKLPDGKTVTVHKIHEDGSFD